MRGVGEIPQPMVTTTGAACLICGSKRLAPLHENVRDRYGIAAGRYAFLRCDECGSATLVPSPGAEELPRLYPAAYTYKGEADSSGDPGIVTGGVLATAERWFYRAIYRERLRIFGRLTGLDRGRVLEVGCGSGHFLAMLRAAGWEVEGLDVSAGDVAFARWRLGLTVFHGSLETVPLDPGRYDAVVLYAVLEHVLDPVATVRRVFELLRPGGVIVVGVPVVDSLQAALFGARWGAVTEAPRHVSLPSSDGVRWLFRETGFRDVRSAPAPLLDNAGYVALSLLPGASTPLSRGHERSVARTLCRCAGALLVLPALAVALVERLGISGAVAGITMFRGRRPEAEPAP